MTNQVNTSCIFFFVSIPHSVWNPQWDQIRSCPFTYSWWHELIVITNIHLLVVTFFYSFFPTILSRSSKRLKLFQKFLPLHKRPSVLQIHPLSTLTASLSRVVEKPLPFSSGMPGVEKHSFLWEEGALASSGASFWHVEEGGRSMWLSVDAGISYRNNCFTIR